MCIDAGLPPRTNHSLRATGATTRFQAEVPERIIEKTTTGHRSLESLCTYERILKQPQVMMSTDSASFTGESNYSAGYCDSRRWICFYKQHGKTFGGPHNCLIGQITINVNPNIYLTIMPGHKKDDGNNDDEFDELLKNVNLDIC